MLLKFKLLYMGVLLVICYESFSYIKLLLLPVKYLHFISSFHSYININIIFIFKIYINYK